MSNYINHLRQMSSTKTFGRKVDYFKYNFSDIFMDIDANRFSVLEVGPGMGESISYLNSIGIKNVDIVDNDKEIVNALVKKYKIRKSILVRDIKLLGRELGTYNLIIMIQVLEHIPINEQHKIVDMLYSHLAKDGIIFIVVPNANNPLGITERYGDLQHKLSYTSQSLKDLINESKIKNFKMQITGFEIPPYSLINVVRIALQKVLHLFLILLMIINGGAYFSIMTPNITLRIKKVA